MICLNQKLVMFRLACCHRSIVVETTSECLFISP